MVVGGEYGHWTTYFEQAEKTGKVKVFGDGNNLIGYGHIDDLVDGIAAVVEAESKLVSGEIFNVTEFDKDKKVTMKDIAVAFARGAGRPNVEVELVPWEPNWAFFDIHIWLDSSKITRVLGWKARHSVMDDTKPLYDAWKQSNKPGVWY